MVVLTTKQVLFQLQPKGIILTTMVVIELHLVVVLTLQSGGLCLLTMWLFQPLLCYFNQSSNFISANTLVASVATYTDKLASVFRTWVSAVHREYHLFEPHWVEITRIVETTYHLLI